MINAILVQINKCLALLRENLFLTLIAIVVVTHLFNRYKNQLSSLLRSRPRPQYVTYGDLSAGSSTTAATTSTTSNTTTTTTRTDDLRRIRELQQQRTDELAKIAAEERKKKVEEERKRKNNIAQRREKWKESGGTQLGTGTPDNVTPPSGRGAGGYNPMQPWSAGTGGGYRPQRRSTNRG